MFDIGFWEIALVGVVALLVLGPERLPKVARVAGMWIGKGRRFMSSVKGEIDRELKADELKRIMAEQAKANDLYEITEQAREGLSQAGNALNQPLTDSSMPANPSVNKPAEPAASGSIAPGSTAASKPAAPASTATGSASASTNKADSNNASKDKADERD